MSLDSAIQHLLKAKRISAPSQSYAKDNPGEWTKVKAYLEGGSRPTGVVTEMGIGLVEVEDERRNVTPPPPPPPPPPSGRYTDIDFTAGKYDGEGISSVFASYSSDSRLSDWGGLPPDLYDSRGCTLDPAARVHLQKGIGGRAGYASWQELRTSDGPWADPTQYPWAARLAKSSLNVSQEATFGPGGYVVGAVRWFAWDYLLPLDIGGVSFEFPSAWHVLADIHSNGGNADPGLVECHPTGGQHPKYVKFATTPDTQSVPYLTVNLMQLTNPDGSRIVSAFNVWHEFVLGIKFAPDSSGWVEVWHDGQQKLTRTNRATVAPSEGGPYIQLQNYTEYPTSYQGGKTRSALAYGGLRAGLARADVQTR